jgi:hypothetical protein
MYASVKLFWSRLDGTCSAVRHRLDRMTLPVFVFATVILALGISLSVLTPRLFVLLGPPFPGTFEWDRGMNFIKQVADPFNAEIEPALRWRLAPALLGYFTGLRGYGAFAIPWVGLIAAFVYMAVLAERRMRDRLDAVLLVVLAGTLAAVQSVTMAHGINDGWLLLALLATAFSGNNVLRAGAALVGPWVDERYLFALPLCLACRAVFPPVGAKPVPLWRFAPWEIVGAALYLGVRLMFTLQHGDPVSGDFVRNTLMFVPGYLPHGPLGWWMGQRAAWVLVIIAVIAAALVGGRSAAAALVLTATLGFAAIQILAMDLTRSTNFFLPLTFAGAFAAEIVVGTFRTRWLVALVALNCILPFAMLTYRWILPMHSLPFELVRLYKNW